MNTPNKLTVLRILLVPVLLATMFLIPENLYCGWVASLVNAALFGLISLTDMLDGKLARKHNLITNFGKFLDPLADKILVVSVLVAFISMGYISSLVVIIVIIREFAVTSLRLIAASDNVVIAASPFGKLKTVFQIITILVLFLNPLAKNYLSGFNFNYKLIFDIFSWAMAVITVLSGADYIKKNIHLINHTK